jgi:HD-like signal output (HDOD) protein
LDKLATLSPNRSHLLVAVTADDPDMAELIRWVESDVLISARTLRVANSAFYGLPQQVDSVGHAVALVGLRSLQSMVLAAVVMEQFRSDDAQLQHTLVQHWKHAVGVAVCARKLAPRARLGAETAFTAGLLHDIGRLVMAMLDPSRYRMGLHQEDDLSVPGTEAVAPLLLAERRVWGFDHCQVGSMLAARWKLPPSLSRCMALHHDCGHPEADDLVCLVHVANAVAHALDLLQDPDDQVPNIHPEAWQRLNLDWSNSPALLADMEITYQQVCRQLLP